MGYGGRVRCCTMEPMASNFVNDTNEGKRRVGARAVTHDDLSESSAAIPGQFPFQPVVGAQQHTRQRSRSGRVFPVHVHPTICILHIHTSRWFNLGCAELCNYLVWFLSVAAVA